MGRTLCMSVPLLRVRDPRLGSQRPQICGWVCGCQRMLCFHVLQDRLSKKWEHSGGKKVLLVKVKELDGKAKTLHVQSPRIPPPSWLPVTRCPFRPEVPFHWAITPLADRRASANINVISQRAERTEAAPSRARRHIAHVLPSRLCHGTNRARQGGACGSRVLGVYFICADLKRETCAC